MINDLDQRLKKYVYELRIWVAEANRKTGDFTAGLDISYAYSEGVNEGSARAHKRSLEYLKENFPELNESE